MAAADRPVDKPRPVYLNLFAIRQPLPAIVSILHRISGALLFLVGIPLLLWFVQRSLASPDGFAAAMRAADDAVRQARAARCWRGRTCYHLLAGIRHLALDLHIGIDSRRRAVRPRVVLVLSVAADAGRRGAAVVSRASTIAGRRALRAGATGCRSA